MPTLLHISVSLLLLRVQNSTDTYTLHTRARKNIHIYLCSDAINHTHGTHVVGAGINTAFVDEYEVLILGLLFELAHGVAGVGGGEKVFLVPTPMCVC